MQAWYESRGLEKWRSRTQCKGVQEWDKRGGTCLPLETKPLQTIHMLSVKNHTDLELKKTQLLGTANKTKKNYPTCIKDIIYSEF